MTIDHRKMKRKNKEGCDNEIHFVDQLLLVNFSSGSSPWPLFFFFSNEKTKICNKNKR